ncbi:MAG: 4Fe-4S ferredoxin [Actinobacteria bacterium HGW-Actinobacteria-7]|nr:MAG: 4Fe-4S ferredoxin [Actinobacteria bacterium HGW-Actinobacteria-7]
MCQFCVEHGEGERWYLQAKNYAFDLESDLKRRDYMVDFISGFPQMREGAIKWLDRAEYLPAPLARAGKAAASRHMQKLHFGQVLPLEECEKVFALATSITVIPCICRMNTPGKKADEVCILVTTQPVTPILEAGFKDYESGPGLEDFHTVTSDEAMALVRSCEDEGLLHSVWTFHTPFAAAICNCNLESGCMAMRLTAGYELQMMWRAETVAVLDEEQCTACGRCARICPFDAFTAEKGRVTLHAEQCYGCGICRSVCRSDALALVDRSTVPAVATLW